MPSSLPRSTCTRITSSTSARSRWIVQPAPPRRYAGRDCPPVPHVDHQSDEEEQAGRAHDLCRSDAPGALAVSCAAPHYGAIVTLVTFHRIAEPRYTTLGSLQPISCTSRPASSSPRPRLVCAQPTTLSVARSIL